MVLIAQITDTHLLDHPEAEMRGVKTDASFQAVLAAVQQFKPDRLILTGDLAHHGEAISYERLRDLVEATQIPSYWLPGNHDDPELMAGILQGDYLSPDKNVALGNWKLLLLDSFLENPEYGEGFLDTAQLAWLAERLEHHQNSPVAIAIHHHVVPAGVDWLDQIDMTNRAEFWQIVQHHPQVKTVFLWSRPPGIQRHPRGNSLLWYAINLYPSDAPGSGTHRRRSPTVGTTRFPSV